MVVIPTIFSSKEGVRELVERLEVHFLANQDEHLHFALLGDFADAAAEEMPDDSALLDVAFNGIADLNRRYSKDALPTFHLFHRRRIWNPNENSWMGWERKRGKLHEFNRVLRGARDTSFIVQTGEPALYSTVRFVITLDSDTQLPRDVARKLVGTALHPLNRPQLDATVNRVVKGYSILQPRVSIALLSASCSRFARIFSGNTGIDPYTTAVSDVYQDLFGEGNYTGKGLYEVDAFEAALKDRVPENSLLSHDLFESLFARAALITDIELLDDYPAHYDTYAKRQHRWTRGDWQIASWLFPRVPAAGGNRVPNTLPLSSRWKILDNLRRSLVAPSLFLWLLAAWLFFPGSTFFWSLFAILVIAFPVYLHVTTSLLIHPRGIPWTSHFWSVWGDIRTNTAQVGLSLVLLAHQAYLMVHAIVRTLYRKLISHRKLLQWVTAAQAERSARHNLSEFFWFMLPAELLVAIAGVSVFLVRPAAIGVMMPFLVIWAISPLVAYLVSRPATRAPRVLTGADQQFARVVARRTWRFFETFVGAEDNWLPPDNYQEDPKPFVAHRTSPTNIGMLLLSTAAAHDFGYLGLTEFVQRQAATLATMRKLAKLHGHFFNWYDTKTLQPLMPQYISTVDSGNLAGTLIALKQMCIELPDLKLFDTRILSGLKDTLSAISFEAERIVASRQRTEIVTARQLREEIAASQQLLDLAVTESLTFWASLFASLRVHGSTMEDIVEALAQEHGAETYEELKWWAGRFSHQVSSFENDLRELTPWAVSSVANSVTLPAHANPEKTEDSNLIVESLKTVPTLADLPDFIDSALVQLAAQDNSEPANSTSPLLALGAPAPAIVFKNALENAAVAARELLSRLSSLAHECDEIFNETDFSFLFDQERKLFAIGYNASDLQADNSFYDLLASEARLASFVAIAKGDVPQEHWFRMGRQLTSVNGESGPHIVDRDDVRIPDAVAGDAHLRRHTFGSDLPSGGGAANRVWQGARRAVGDF